MNSGSCRMTRAGSLAALCLLACATYAASCYLGTWGVIVGVWCVVEVAFFGVQQLRYEVLNEVNDNRPSSSDINERFQNFLTLAPVLDIQEFISGWFLHIPFSEIKADNVADFIAYAYWYRPRSELSADEQKQVLNYTAAISQAWNVKFPEGSNDSLQLMSHLWQPLKVVHKPLIVHLMSEGSMLLTHLALQALGFKRFACMGFTYWALRLPDPLESDRDVEQLTAIQSVLKDLRGLLLQHSERGTRADGASQGPLDLLASYSLQQLQALQEYQARLNDAIVALTPTLPDSLPGLVTALQNSSVSQLSKLPAFRDLDTMSSFEDLSDIPLPSWRPGQLADTAVKQLPALPHLWTHLPSVSSLSTLPAFRDLQDMHGFEDLEDLRGSIPAARDLRGLRALSALGSFGLHLPDLRVVLGALGLRRSWAGEMSSSVLAARAALLAAMPIFNLPDWQLQGSPASSGAAGAPEDERGGSAGGEEDASDGDHELHDMMRALAQRLHAVAVATVERAAVDGFLGRARTGDSDTSPTSADNDQRGRDAQRSGHTAASLIRNGLSAATDSALVRAWVDAARSTLQRSVCPLFSGVLLPSPEQLVAAGGPVSPREPAVDRVAAAALRKTVEGTVLSQQVTQRSSLDLDLSDVRHRASLSRSASEAASLVLNTPSRSGSPREARCVPEALAAPRTPAKGAVCSTPTAEHSGPLIDRPAAGKQPIVFLHGVGFGIFPYLGFVGKLLQSFKDRPFILLEVRHVSLRLCMRARGVDDVVRVLAAVLARHNVQAANFVGHSFGTFVIAHMRKLYPDMVASMLLCDPVCMLTCFPKLLYNFIYRGVTLRDLMDNPAEAGRWLAARDLIIAATFCRHFWWHTLMLWPWELPEPSVVVLSGKDTLVPSELVQKHLRDKPGFVQVLHQPDLHHGHFLFRPKWQDSIVAAYQKAIRAKEAQQQVATDTEVKEACS